jgi:two-component system, OmpR family, sensor kinase
MVGTGWFRRDRDQAILWATFAMACVGVALLLPEWERVVFYVLWASLAFLYGLRAGRFRFAIWVIAALVVVIVIPMHWLRPIAPPRGAEERDVDLIEFVLLTALLATTLWHARARERVMEEARELSARRGELLQIQLEMVRDLSHELRTPLTIARGYLELLRDEYAGQQVAVDADIILHELDRIARVSEHLLILAISDQPDFLRLDTVAIDEFVKERFDRWSTMNHRRDWRLLVRSKCTVFADEERLIAALDAILENAVKFTEDGGLITVATYHQSEACVIEVTDDGMGIPPEVLDRVFDRRWRASRSSELGTGLGLAIVKAIVEAHGGTVSAASQVGHGSTFRLKLPSQESYPPTTSASDIESGATRDQVRRMTSSS